MLSDRPVSSESMTARRPRENVGRYLPCFELESGGMATVYLARAAEGMGFSRFVALKRIHPHLVAEPGFVEMFLDEANVLSRIVHPNVCTVYDFGEEERQYYIAMEYLMGEPLSRVARAMQIEEAPEALGRTLAIVARVIADACEGLHAAHELRSPGGELLGVVHRDVSPQNLFLTYDGAVKVVDFGLVRTSQAIHRTRTGIVKGKFAYLAPEALARRPVDRRADIWGLGVVLWELVTQQRLFYRESEVDTLMAVKTGVVPPPSTVRDDIPKALDAIVAKALAQDPADRYRTAREMGQDLLRFAHGCPEPVGLADLSRWMERLFPAGRARKHELLEIASQLAASEMTTIFPRPPRVPGNASAQRQGSTPPPAITEGRKLALSSAPPPTPAEATPREAGSAPEASDRTSQGLEGVSAPWRPTSSQLVAVGAVLIAAGAMFHVSRSWVGPVAEGATSPARASAAAWAPSSNALGRSTAASAAAPQDVGVAPPEACSAATDRYVLEVVPDAAGDDDQLVVRVRPAED